MSDSITRRAAIGASLAAAIAPAQQVPSPLTAGVVIDRIRNNVQVPWREQTVDKIIAGTSDVRVAGIATTMMATLSVLRKAAAHGLNMVITHEPTFYSHQDAVDQLQDDAIYKFKLDFIRRNDLAVFHFHDHWHARKPDGIATGMARELGWQNSVDAENPRLFSFATPKPLAELSREIQSKLGGIRTMRVIGDQRMPIQRAIASWGYVSQFPGIPLFARPDIDVLIVGETREWELVEYAQDAIDSGKKKALIVLGHVVSEQAGMKYCAEWLKPFIPEVPIRFVPAVEPFWNPDHAV